MAKTIANILALVLVIVLALNICNVCSMPQQHNSLSNDLFRVVGNHAMAKVPDVSTHQMMSALGRKLSGRK
uniref:Uncharacterized protein n=1 Tax=Globodera rostochiensis TaxID=31243 RepID=A0A914GPK3_GLORO